MKRNQRGQTIGMGTGNWLLLLVVSSSLLMVGLSCAAVEKVGIVFDATGRGDVLCNDMAYLGASKAASELGLGITDLTGSAPSEYSSTLRSLASSGDCILIICSGYGLQDALQEAAREFPSQRFAIIDAVVTAPNVMSIVFREEEISALIGCLAGMAAAEHGSGATGVVFGMPIAPLWRFESGYRFGQTWGLQRYAELTGHQDGVAMLYEYTGTFTDPAAGKAASETMLAQGAVGIFNVAGLVGAGDLEAITEFHERAGTTFGPPYHFGVDGDQDWMGMGAHSLASGMKRSDVAAYNAVAAAASGSFRPGESVLGLAEGGVGMSSRADLEQFIELATAAGKISDRDRYEIISNWVADRGTIPDFIWAAVDELRQEIIGGRVVVPAASTEAEIEKSRMTTAVVLRMPQQPMFTGSYAKVRVLINPNSGLTIDDLCFRVPAGPHAGLVSLSRDSDYDPANPDIMLLAGSRPGSYQLEASDSSSEVLAAGAFSLTDYWPDDAVGPSLWIEGIVQPQEGPASSSLGGGPGGPQNIAIIPAPSLQSVAIVLIDFSSTKYDSAEVPTIQNTWHDAVERGTTSGGVTRSAKAYYQETSFSKLDVTADVFGPCTVDGDWDRYFTVGGAARATALASFISAADTVVDYTRYTTILFVTPEKRYANYVRFAWPQTPSSQGTYGTEDGYVTLSCIVMPNIWDPSLPEAWGRTRTETFAHELGHCLHLPDEYVPNWEDETKWTWQPRRFDPPAPYDNFMQALWYPHLLKGAGGYWRYLMDWDLMGYEAAYPQLPLVSRMMLGWVKPEWVLPLNFAGGTSPEPVSVRLSPIESGVPGTGQRAGIEIRIADRWNIYVEYRNARSGQISDQGLPEGNRILVTDVRTPSTTLDQYGALDTGKQRMILLVPTDYDLNPAPATAVLDTGEIYHYEDPTDPTMVLTIAVVGIYGNEAEVTVTYGAARPDPYIAPWPERGEHPYQSPDIAIENPLALTDPNLRNVPLRGHDNTVVAYVTNGGTLDAPDVQVDFFATDYSVADPKGKTIQLESATRAVPVGKRVRFETRWQVPADPTHYCITAQIVPYTHPEREVVEAYPGNNRAMSNYDRFVSSSSSPASRAAATVAIGNPFAEPRLIIINPRQSNPLYRTYIEHRWLSLPALTSEPIRVMFEYVGSVSTGGGSERYRQHLDQPNTATITASAWNQEIRGPLDDTSTPIGGVEALVETGRRTVIDQLAAFSETEPFWVVWGRVLEVSTAAPVPGGEILLLIRRSVDINGDGVPDAEREEYLSGNVDGNGRFEVSLTGRWNALQAYYVPHAGLLPQAGFVDCESEVLLSPAR